MTYQDFAELIYSNYLKFGARIILSNNVDNSDVDIEIKDLILIRCEFVY